MIYFGCGQMYCYIGSPPLKSRIYAGLGCTMQHFVAVDGTSAVAKWLLTECSAPPAAILVVLPYKAIGFYSLRQQRHGLFPPWTCTNKISGAGLRRPIAEWETYRGVRGLKSPFSSGAS